MRSRIEIELQANGVLADITQGLDKIFQGAVGVTEYYLTVASGLTGDYNWRQTDVVYMVLKRNDGATAQVKMTPNGTGWNWTSNGWENDIDISGETGTLEVSFVAKRYSTVSLGVVASEKTTQKINLLVYASAGYLPQNIDIEIAEELQEAINVLQLDKVGRYSVSAENLPYLPAEIVYDVDGAKSPNNIYYDFTANVVDFDDSIVEKTGAILVLVNGAVQTELFVTSDGKTYSRTITGSTATDFVSTAKADFEFFTYDKTDIDAKDAATLQSAKDYADDNFYDETEADGRFVHLTGNESINGTKTFVESPITPDPTANTHAVNRQSMYNYTYSKNEIVNINTPMSVDTYAHFLEWIAGTYTNVSPAGTTPADFLVGKKVFILESGVDNYRCISIPVTSISNFEVLAEDVKSLTEINADAYKDIPTSNAQTFVNTLKDQLDDKAQVTEEADLEILTTDWVDDTDKFYFDYFNANFTNPLTQRFVFVSNNITQNQTLLAEKVAQLGVTNITSGSDYGLRIFVNKVPSIDITYKVLMASYTDTAFVDETILANMVVYDNTTSGLTATTVQGAVDELASEKIDKTLSIITTTPQYAVMLQTNGNPKYMQNASIGQVLMAGQAPKNAIYDEYGKLGSLTAPTENTDYANKLYVDTAPKNYIDFTTTAVTLQERRMHWTETYGTLEAQLKNGVVLQIGQEFYFYGKATETITNGQVIAIAGSVGGNLLFKVADQADIDYSADLICGVATQDIANNSFGYVTRVGRVGTLNTYAWTEGTIIYFDGSGGLTSTRPTNGHPIVQIGVVEAQASSPSSNNGRIVVDLKINRITQSVVGQSEFLAPSAKAVYDYLGSIRQHLYKHDITIQSTSGTESTAIFITLYLGFNTALTSIDDIIDNIYVGNIMASGRYRLTTGGTTDTIRPITYIVKSSGILYAGLMEGYQTTGSDFTFLSTTSLLDLTGYSVTDSVSVISII